MAAKAEKMEKYRNMNQNELEIQERDLGEQIFRLRFQLTTGPVRRFEEAAGSQEGSRAGEDAAAREGTEEKVMANETAAPQQGAHGTRRAPGTDRRGDQRQDAEDHRGEGDAHHPASALSPRRALGEEILCAR